jgi:H+/Cl- antiporter ClcA
VRAQRIGTALHLLSTVVAASIVGTISGVGAWALFDSLDRATNLRLDHPWLLWLLPMTAMVLGLTYHRLGGESRRGTSLVIERSLPPYEGENSESPSPRVPARMAPLIFASTFLAQLCGASVGREGAALQIGGSLTSFVTRPLRLSSNDSRLMLIAAIAGSFGGAFGVPIAGAIFALEVQQTGRLRYEGLAPALSAAITADFVVESLGRSTPIRTMTVDADWSMYVRLAIVGLVAGLTARAFVTLLRWGRSILTRRVPWAPLRPAIGGTATVLLALMVGRDYLGLSLPLADSALGGITSHWWDPVLKLIFTVVALSSSIPGGEVTPLFVIGATLGSVLSVPLGLPAALTSGATYAAVFGAASNTPIACAILTSEMFGASTLAPAAIVGILAYSVSPRRGIYEGQRIGSTKDLRASA